MTGMDTLAKKLVIVGGGAAGLAAAVSAGERARERGARLEIEVLERDDRVGRSILATGNGRCNFSNAHPYVDDYRNEEFVDAVFWELRAAYMRDMPMRDRKIVGNNGVVHAFFYKHGLMWREEEDGRHYPKPNKASTIVDILRASAACVGVRESCEREVSAIEPPRERGGRFTLRMADSTLERADAVIVACGGRALSALDVAALPVIEQTPVLGPLRCSDECIPVVRELDNIRVRCVVSLMRNSSRGEKVIAEEKGELMFRKYGVSGICVFNLSRFALPGDTLSVNFLDGCNLSDAKDFLFRRRKLLVPVFGGDLTCSDMMRGMLLPRVADAVLKQAGLRPKAAFAKAQVPDLAQALVSFRLGVAGIGDVANCQVRRGGLDVGAFDPRTMGAFGVLGLFAAGEALDVDGPCGGYNLHWAWSSGLLAGLSAADLLCGEDGDGR